MIIMPKYSYQALYISIVDTGFDALNHIIYWYYIIVIYFEVDFSRDWMLSNYFAESVEFARFEKFMKFDKKIEDISGAARFGHALSDSAT